MLPTSRAVFRLLCGDFAGGRDSRADLSAISRGSHRGICGAAIGDSEQRGSLLAVDLSARGGGRAALEAAREIAAGSGRCGEIAGGRRQRAAAGAGRVACVPHGSRVRKAATSRCCNTRRARRAIPKGVVLTHANFLANMRAHRRSRGHRPQRCGRELAAAVPRHGADRRVAHVAAVRHSVGGDVAAGVSDAAGAMAARRFKNTAERSPRRRILLTNCACAKLPIRTMEGVDLSSWRAALNGAEPVNPETLERFAKRFAKYGFREEAQLPVYGLAEASLGVTVPPLNRGPLSGSRASAKLSRRRPRCAGARGRRRPRLLSFLPEARCRGTKCRSWTRTAMEVDERTEGFLWFRGPSATSGYYKMQEATAQLFAAGAGERRRRISVGEFRRSRVSCRRRNIRHRPREGHHHQRRAKSLPARSGRAGIACGRNSQGMRGGVRIEG